MGNTSSNETVDAEPKPTNGHGPEAYLNVYEPTNESQRGVMGMGIYHSGVEISGQEYAYGGGSVSASGVYTQTPKTDPPGGQWKFKCSIRLGKITPTGSQLNKVLYKIKDDFPANKYNVMGNNCNHFTEAFAQALGVGMNYPAWVNRAAKMGNRFGLGGAAPADPAAPPPQESVFKTSKGHSLIDDDHKSSSSSKSQPPGKRVNPWANPNFKPKNIVDDSAVVKGAPQ